MKGTTLQVKPGEAILFVMKQRPRVGIVKEILTDSQHTVLVHLWKPSAKARSLASAKYRPSYCDKEEELIQVHPMYVVKTGVAFDEEGHLNALCRSVSNDSSHKTPEG